MEKIIEKIQTLSAEELPKVMEAIERRYAEAYPEWDVVYIALHKDPVLRKEEYERMLKYIAGDLEWCRQRFGAPEAP